MLSEIKKNVLRLLKKEKKNMEKKVGEKTSFTRYYDMSNNYAITNIDVIEGIYLGRYTYVGNEPRPQYLPQSYDCIQADKGGLYMIPIE